MYKEKRGQAAMEFLMTYGWAILAAVIVVGVLWYLIGNPANLAGNNFQMSAPLVANAMALNTTQFQFEVRNGAGGSITVTGIDMGTTDCTDQTGLTTVVADGSLQVFNVVCALTAGDRLNSDITIQYTTSGSSVTQMATGSVSGKVP